MRNCLDALEPIGVKDRKDAIDALCNLGARGGDTHPYLALGNVSPSLR